MSLLGLRPAPHTALPSEATVGFRWGGLARQRRTAVGIDIGGGTLKVAQIRWSRNGPRLENYAVVPVPGGAMLEGAVADPVSVGELVRSTLAEMNVTQTTVGSCVGGPSIIMRYINLPKVPADELRNAMKFEAPQQIPIAEGELVYDFTPVPEAQGLPEHQMAVFLAGTQKRLIDSHIATLYHAQVRPSAIELDCLAALRSLEYLGLVPFKSQNPVVLLDFGESSTRIAILRHQVPMLARTVSTGLQQLRMAVADSLGLSAADAERELRTKGLQAEGELAAAIDPWMRELLESLGRSIEYFLIQDRGINLDKVLLIGGGAVLPSLAERLAEHLKSILASRPDEMEIKVQPVGLAGLDINPMLLPGIKLFEPLLVTALGSALREGEEEE